ncbi:MAG: ParA family protein [Roseburia faecis]
MKAIAMFNNKGGVGKTTLTCNLSAYIARTGKKVMLIDADPQCNSTIYCFTDDLFSKVYYDKRDLQFMT